MQARPVCALCSESIEDDFVYEAPCGNDDCPSAVWHPECLMDWREMTEEEPHEVESLMERMASLAQDFQKRILGP